MTNDKKPADVLAELANVPFPNAAYVDSMKKVIAAQKQMLDGFQSNLEKWFERRREGAEAAIDMLTELDTATDHGKRAEAWQRWASGAMARIMEDVQTQFDMMSRITDQLADTAQTPKPSDTSQPEAAPANIQPLFRNGTNPGRNRKPPNGKRK